MVACTVALLALLQDSIAADRLLARAITEAHPSRTSRGRGAITFLTALNYAVTTDRRWAVAVALALARTSAVTSAVTLLAELPCVVAAHAWFDDHTKIRAVIEQGAAHTPHLLEAELVHAHVVAVIHVVVDRIVGTAACGATIIRTSIGGLALARGVTDGVTLGVAVRLTLG